MNSFQIYLSQYKLDSLISAISNISKDMYIRDIFWEQEPFYKEHKLYRLKLGDVLKTAWGVTDIIYHAIVNGSDFKGRKPNKEDIINIFNEYVGYSNALAEEKVKELKSTEIFYGLSQKQFWYQKKQMIYEQISRNIELLQYIPKQINSTIPIESIIFEKVGLSHFDFLKIILLLFGRCLDNLDFTIVSVDKNLQQLDKCFTEENIRRVIDYFSSDYKTIINSPLEENFLHTKPFIKTQSGKIFACNHFLVSKKCADGIYWLIRNYYEELKKQDFTNEFGKYFESYFGDLLNYYLEKSTYERLQGDEREKIADWAVYSTNYILLVEQKSSLASLKTKTEYPELNYLRRFLDNFVKAFVQLDRTESEIEFNKKGRVVVKVALHYEDIFVQSLIKGDILNNLKGELSSTENYFIIGISEMEKLISVLAKDEKHYESIIQDLIIAQSAPISEGRELEHILQNHKIIENDYIKNVKNHLDLIFKELQGKKL